MNKNLANRAFFYPILIISSFVLYKILNSLLYSLFAKECLEGNGECKFGAGLSSFFYSIAIVPTLAFIITLVYEIIKYKKNKTIIIENSENVVQKNKKSWKLSEVLPMFFILLPLFSLFQYLPIFGGRVELKNLLTTEIIFSSNTLIFYILLFFSLITLYSSAKRKRISNILVVLNTAIFIIYLFFSAL